MSHLIGPLHMTIPQVRAGMSQLIKRTHCLILHGTTAGVSEESFRLFSQTKLTISNDKHEWDLRQVYENKHLTGAKKTTKTCA